MRLTRTRGHRPAVTAVIGALVLAGGSAALAATKAGPYSGTTAQALPLRFGVSHGAKLVTNFEPTFTARCKKKGSPDITTPKITTDAGRNITIKKKKFSARGLNGRVRSGTKVVATGTDSVSGKFTSAKSVKGTYTVSLKFSKAAPGGFAGYRCTTGKLKWSAKTG